ncbi:MAG: Hpt domain-containing protein [Desulfobacteraceae bacterium]|jgi:HPt (histidine-containing phosphotransfer) domain-containing protein
MNFKELAENLGLEVDEYRELIELFVDTGASDFQKIADGLSASDSELVMRSAHTIKGAAGNLGLMDVSETAGIIEENASKNRLNDLSTTVNVLKTQFEAIEAFVNN